MLLDAITDKVERISLFYPSIVSPRRRLALLKQQLSKFNRNVIPRKRAPLCSEHFEADCFEEDLRAKYVGRSPGKRDRGILKTNAVLGEGREG